MRKQRPTLAALCSAAVLAAVLSSCDISLHRQDSELTGGLTISFNPESFAMAEAGGTKSGGGTKSVPDSNSFILTVTSQDGRTIYSGLFGDSPQTIFTQPGTYSVSAVSCIFQEPVFETPQYGDEQLVVVEAGKTSYVQLECAQTNAGMKILFSSAFRSNYPDGVLYLKSAQGKLMYGYNEKRTAFFKPGSVSLSLVNGISEQTLTTKTLAAQEILTLRLNSTGATTADGIYIQVDTTRNWTYDEYTDGGRIAGDDTDSALSVSEARSHVGEKDIWVYGYVCGTSTSSTKSEFYPPFSTNTNILLCSRSSTQDRNSCLSVELAKGDAREVLNLKDHPENLGFQVYIKGDIVESYYGLTGIKNVSDCRWK